MVLIVFVRIFAQFGLQSYAFFLNYASILYKIEKIFAFIKKKYYFCTCIEQNFANLRTNDMKRHVIFLLSLMMSLGLWAKAQRQTVVFDVDIHCQGCITKIEKNIAFEPGVKDLVCNLDEKTVTVTFNPAKTSVEQLQAAFAKINKPAKLHIDANEAHDSNEDTDSGNKDVDAQTGASTPQ